MFVKTVDELEALAKTMKGGHWICGPIQTGKKAEDYLPPGVTAYTFVMHDKPMLYEEGHASYRSISGSYYYLLP